MKTTEAKHNLAVLRKRLNLGQKEMAGLAECTVHMIQSIELRRAKLPSDMARRISLMTGVNLSWLTSTEVNSDPVDDHGIPYSLETYRERRKSLKDANELRPATNMLSGLVADLLAESEKRGLLVQTFIELVLALRELTVKFNEMSKGSLETKWKERSVPSQILVPKIKIDWSATARSKVDALNIHVGQIPRSPSRLRRKRS